MALSWKDDVAISFCHCPTVGIAVGIEVGVGVALVDIDLLLPVKPTAKPAIVERTTMKVITPRIMFFRLDEDFFPDLALILWFPVKSRHSEMVGRDTHL